MCMLNGLRTIFLEALSLVEEEYRLRLVKQWNEQCDEVFNYKRELIVEERSKAADVVKKLEQDVTRLVQENEALKDSNEHLAVLLSEEKTEVAREIFEEIDRAVEDAELEWDTIFGVKLCIAELKKKYTEGKV